MNVYGFFWSKILVIQYYKMERRAIHNNSRTHWTGNGKRNCNGIGKQGKCPNKMYCISHLLAGQPVGNVAKGMRLLFQRTKGQGRRYHFGTRYPFSFLPGRPLGLSTPGMCLVYHFFAFRTCHCPLPTWTINEWVPNNKPYLVLPYKDLLERNPKSCKKTKNNVTKLSNWKESWKYTQGI